MQFCGNWVSEFSGWRETESERRDRGRVVAETRGAKGEKTKGKRIENRDAGRNDREGEKEIER